MADENPHPALGVLVVAVACAPYLAASNVIPADDSDFGVPRWALAWIAVVCFMLPGLMILGGVTHGDGGHTRPGAGIFGPTLAAIVPVVLALHAGQHGLTRSGGVRVAWLALALLVSWVAFLYGRRLLRIFARIRRGA